MKSTVSEQMRSMAELLIEFTHPFVPFSEESEVVPLKERILFIDGYKVLLNFSIADYNEFYLETLQIQSLQGVFLPFNFVIKLGKMFLGTKNLSFLSVFKKQSEIYCWTLRKTKEGKIIKFNQKYCKKAIFEGFEYGVLDPKLFKFQ